MSDTIMVRMRLITQLVAGIHNERVQEVYGAEALTTKDVQRSKRKAILDNFTIDPIQDPYPLIVMKLLGYYLVCDRMSQVASPYLYPEKRDKIKAQLSISYRPVKRLKWFDKNGKVRHSPNGELHVPHWDDSTLKNPPAMLSYTVGNWSVKYTMIDGTYILVHAKTKKEATEVVISLAGMTNPKYRPAGEIKDNLITTERPKAKITLLDGLVIKPFQICYFHGGEQTPSYIHQL
jgi:hypothetical protein